jgi:hypothetical protein
MKWNNTDVIFPEYDKYAICHFSIKGHNYAGLTLKGDSGEEVALWLLTSLCTSAKREVEVALWFYQVALLILTVKKHR